jgi:hypothetical protein
MTHQPQPPAAVSSAGPTRRWFELSLPDSVWRSMTRKQVYEARSYLRRMAREVQKELIRG